MGPESDVTFLLGLAILLGASRLGGYGARRLGWPAVVGELLAGAALGPTVLGRVAPGACDSIFPAAGAARVALDGFRLVAVSLLMLTAGLEIDLGALRRVGRVALATGTGSLVVPFALGFAVAWAAPGALGGAGGCPRLAFALFFATVLAISALPVLARILLDLGLLATDFGSVVLASAMLDDLLGWLVFSLVLGLAAPAAAGLRGEPLHVLAATLAFALFVLTLLRAFLDRVLPLVQARSGSPLAILVPVIACGLLGAAATEALGSHAVIGAFLVGIAVHTDHVSDRGREIVQEFVTSFFSPIFFATLGLRIDYAADFSAELTLLVLVLACAGKLVGAGGAAWLAGFPGRRALAVAAGLNARGAMAIVLAGLGLEAGVVGRPLYVALVVMALATSLVAGPLLERLARPR